MSHGGMAVYMMMMHHRHHNNHSQIAQNDRPDVGPISANVGHDIGLMSEIISGRYRQMSGRLHVCTWARCRPDVVNDIRPTSGRYRLDV